MRKYLHLLLLSLLGIAAQAQTTPAITLTVEVDGNTRTLELATTEGVQKFQIDWGDGKLVETEEIGPNPDGWSWTDVTGTPVGGGEIKIYGGNIGYFACSSRVDGAQVTSLDVTNAPDLTDLTVNTNKLSALDLSHNAKLATLVCGNNPLTQLNLSANTALTSLDGNDLQLTSIDLTHNTALTSLKLNNSKLTQIDLSKNTELTQIYLLGNQLTQIDLSYNDKLTYASLNNNQLTSLDVTGCDALKSLLCMNNQLTELKTNDLTGTVTINGNYLTPATLPVVSASRYNYAPQNPMQIGETVQTGQAIDLSAQDNLTGLAGAPQKTTFTWTTESGTVLEAGTDYTEDGGKFTFLKPQAEPVYCTMETEAFPSFSGTNAFKTTMVKVNGPDGVKGIGATTLAISGGKGTISVAGMAAGSTVEVYDLSGRKVAAQTAMGSRVTFNVKAGLYIVSVNGTARKVNAF